MITKAVRGFLTILILWFVWNNSHWSVSLSLTLIAINNEIAAFVKGKS